VKERREWSGRVRIVGSPDGSFYFDNQPNMLDQFLVNKNIATGDALIKVNRGTAPDPRTASHGRSRSLPQANPIRRNGDPANQNGFSDHFPITMTATEVNRDGRSSRPSTHRGEPLAGRRSTALTHR
jgi:hypothetical protein